MRDKKFVQRTEGKVTGYLEYQNVPDDWQALGLLDVSDREDGPFFVGKLYDAITDTFSDPPEPPPEDDN